MRKTIAAFATSLALAPMSAGATIYAPNFNTPTLDPSLSAFGGSSFSYSTGDGSLKLSYSTPGSSSNVSISGGVASNVTFEGNYSAYFTVDVSGLPFPTPNLFMNGGPTLGQLTASSFVGPWHTSSGSSVAGAVFISGVYVAGPAQNLSSTVVNILVQRVGETIIESIAPAGSSNYSVIYSASGPEFLGTTHMNMDLFYSGTVPETNPTIKYSNVSIAYGNDPSVPQSVTGLTGGTPSNPVPLPSGPIGSVTGPIGGTNSQDFFAFYWSGGLFYVVGEVDGTSAPAGTYGLELLNPDGSVNALVDLSNPVPNGYMGTISEQLAPGYYTIGVLTGQTSDPTYNIDFVTPVRGTAPEPASVSLVGIALAGLGFLRRKYRLSGAGRPTAPYYVEKLEA